MLASFQVSNRELRRDEFGEKTSLRGSLLVRRLGYFWTVQPLQTWGTELLYLGETFGGQIWSDCQLLLFFSPLYVRCTINPQSVCFTVVEQKECKSGKETNLKWLPGNTSSYVTHFNTKRQPSVRWYKCDDTKQVEGGGVEEEEEEGGLQLTDGRFPIRYISTPYWQIPLKISVRQY